MKTTIDIEDDLLDRAKREAARQGISLKTLVTRALRAALAPRASAGRARFTLDFPVVHDERAPLVDVSDRRALYDLMDER